jgi:filamentous hemagglutinin family protein
MKISVLLPPLIAVISLISSEKTACTQVYQPSNRVPVSDNSLGTQVLGSNNNFTITGGISRGQNIFHSFQDFSVPTNGGATFISPTGTQGIVTRVTGSLLSDINGAINTQGANFLLINPNGIVFGPGTQLNVGRVFAASTANSIDLVDSTGKVVTFGTDRAGDAPFLAIDPKVIFNVSRLNLAGGTADIKTFGTLEPNNPSQYIGLIGGDITISGGGIVAPGGRIELGGLSSPGSLEIITGGDHPRLNFSVDATRSNIFFADQSWTSVVGAGSGDIAINAKNVELTNGSVIRGGIKRGEGNTSTIAGDIKVDATGEVAASGNSLIVNNVRDNSKGNSGNIIINAGSILLRENAQIDNSTLGQGNAGNVLLTAKDSISLVGSGAESNRQTAIFTTVDPGGIGKGGNIDIKATSFFLTNGAQLVSSTLGQGNAGNVTLNSRNAYFDNGSILSRVEPTGTGRGGDINTNTSSLSLTNGSQFETSVFGQGNAGNIDLNTSNTFALEKSNLFSVLYAGAIGNAGGINIKADAINTSNSQVSTSTLGNGNAGNISLTAKNSVFATNLSAFFSVVGAGGVGKGGDININATSFSLLRGSQLLAITEGTSPTQPIAGKGDAGNINIKATESVNITDRQGGLSSTIASSIGIGAEGNGGNITIDTGSLSLQNAAGIQSSTLGLGNAGNVAITAREGVSIVGVANDQTAILSTVEAGGVGKGGNIDIDTGALLLRDKAAITTSTLGVGSAGNVTIHSRNDVSLIKGSVFSTVAAGGMGKGGDINISTNSLSLLDNAILQTGTNGAVGRLVAGKGDAGNINLKVNETIDIRNSQVLSRTGVGTEGKGGNINVEVGSLLLRDDARISALSSGVGDAGSISVAAKNTVGLQNNSQLVAATFGQGNAGTIKVNATGPITLSDQGRNSITGLFVDSTSDTGIAGNIIVTSPQITLDNNVAIASTSRTGQGGNIDLSGSDLLLLRRGAQIATNAAGTAQQSSNAGNININSKLVVAISTENSDITANAVGGKGGNVNINTQGLLGTQLRPQKTNRSDITASSDFGQNGNIIINTPGIDPGKNTGELPKTPTDTSKQISQTCSSNQQISKLYITGRGGQPLNTDEPPINDVVWIDPRTPSTHNNANIQHVIKISQPAVDWAFDSKGKVTLLATRETGINNANIFCPTINSRPSSR